MKSQNFPYDEKTFEKAMLEAHDYGSLNNLEWLYENQFPIPDDAYDISLALADERLMNWLVNKGLVEIR